MTQIDKEVIRVLSSAEVFAEFIDDAAGADLVNIGVNLKRCIDALTKADKTAKAKIKESAVDGVLNGTNCHAKVVEAVRWTLDTSAVKEEMGEDWYTSRCKQSLSVSVRYGV